MGQLIGIHRLEVHSAERYLSSKALLEVLHEFGW